MNRILLKVHSGRLVALDLQGAERDAVPAMRMVERAARIAVHAGDLALLELVVADDGLEVAPLQLGADRLAHDRPDHIEHLARREAIGAMAARLGDRRVEMGEHHLLLAALASWLGRLGAQRAAHGLAGDLADDLAAAGQVRRLAVGGDRHVGRDDVDAQIDARAPGGGPEGAHEAAAVEREIALPAREADRAGDRRAVDQHRAAVAVGVALGRGPGLDHEGDGGARAADAAAAERALATGMERRPPLDLADMAEPRRD